MQQFSFHTHTIFSDGKNSAEEMLNQAVKLGWSEIGISDHLIIHENITASPSWCRWQKEPHIFWNNFEKIYDYFARNCEYIRKISDNYPLKIRLGAEVDFFPYGGWIEKFIKIRERLDLDYCISGNHYLILDDQYHNLLDIKDVDKIDSNQQVKAIRRHLKTLCLAAQSGLFEFIAHIDYMRKIDIFTDPQFDEDKKEVIEFFAHNDITTEISTKGLRKNGVFYPCLPMLKQLVDNRVKLVISDDAHRVEELGYQFDYAEKTLQELNCVNRWSFVDK